MLDIVLLQITEVFVNFLLIIILFIKQELKIVKIIY